MNKFGKIFAVIAAIYAGIIAFAMKKRKDEGNSKLPSNAKKSTLGNVVDEVVDIHKDAYHDTKEFVINNLEDVKDFDSLKSKMKEIGEDFSSQIEKKMEALQEGASDAHDVVKNFLEDAYGKVSDAFSQTEAKAKDFAEEQKEEAQKLIDDTKKELEKKYKSMKSKLTK